jgi:hypothetical protein
LDSESPGRYKQIREAILHPDISLPIEPQIPAYLICNIDETPLGFEEMANYNYVGEGSKTVELNTSKVDGRRGR